MQDIITLDPTDEASFSIRPLTAKDTSAVLAFIKNQVVSLPDQFFYTPADELINLCLNSTTGLSLGAFVGHRLIGIRLTFFPKQTEFNHGRELGYTAEMLDKTAQFQGTVIDNAFRAKGIGRELVLVNCKLIFESGHTNILTTVHPANLASIKMLFQSGFKMRAFRIKYGNLPRYVFEKKIEPPSAAITEIVTVDVTDNRRIEIKLSDGYIGTELLKVNNALYLKLEK